MSFDSSTPIFLLFLLIYTLAAVGIFLPLISGRRHKKNRLYYSGRFLQTFSIIAIIPSIQVLLNALDIFEGLPGLWPSFITFLFNSIILVSLWLASRNWVSLTRVYSPENFFTDLIEGPLQHVTTGFLFLNVTVQVPLLFSKDIWVFQIVQYSMIPLFILLFIQLLFGSIRIFRLGIIALNSILPLFILIIIFYSFFDYPIGQIFPLILLLLLYALILSVYIGEMKTSEAEPDKVRIRMCSDAGLTPREQEIAILLSEGYSYKELSGNLNISLSTIQTHVSRIYGKMNVNSKTELSRKLNS